MSIKIIDQGDVHVTETELRRYRDEYRRAYSFYAGTPPTLEDFIRSRQMYERSRSSDAEVSWPLRMPS